MVDSNVPGQNPGLRAVDPNSPVDPNADPNAPPPPAVAPPSSGIMGMLESLVAAMLPDEAKVQSILDSGREAAMRAAEQLLLTLEGKIKDYYIKHIKRPS